MSVVVATAYMEEAERFDWLVAMNASKILAAGTPAELKTATGARTVEEAFIALLPEQQRAGHRALHIPPRRTVDTEPVIAARGLTCRFGDFTAVDHVSFTIERGEIFGFVGSNGCGKTTTMKMLTGLLPASEGEALLFGRPLDASDLNARNRVGYMSQSFSLYAELTVRQNLDLHARLFHLPARKAKARVAELIGRFGLADHVDQRAQDLPLGIRQRLSLAVAIVHEPEMLILDEPTSGVDPLARDRFWELLIDLSRNEGVTIFVSTHFMNEAERCDRISLMDSGHVLATDYARGADRGARRRDAGGGVHQLSRRGSGSAARRHAGEARPAQPRYIGSWRPSDGRAAVRPSVFDALSPARSAKRWNWCAIRSGIGFAVFGTTFLMLVFGFGISTDVNSLTFAVLDHDQQPRKPRLSRRAARLLLLCRKAAARRLCRSRKAARRWRQSTPASKSRPGFGRDIARGRPAWVAAWIDGARPFIAQTIRGYLQAMHQLYLTDPIVTTTQPAPPPPADIEVRFKYNQNFDSVYAMVPAQLALGAGAIPGDPDGARRRPRKGARFDHQPLCDAGDPARISAGQAAALCRAGDGQFRADVHNGAVRLRGAAQGELSRHC